MPEKMIITFDSRAAITRRSTTAVLRRIFLFFFFKCLLGLMRALIDTTAPLLCRRNYFTSKKK